MPNSKKKCKHCQDWFAADSMMKTPRGAFCNMSHAIEWGRKQAKAKAEKARKAKHREDLRRVRRNPRAEALVAAQLLARISRADDNGYCKCVTCGKVGKYNDGFDGGHYIEKGKSQYWMLEPKNIHPQCASCNRKWSSGGKMKTGDKGHEYTLYMIDTYGREFVDHMHAMKREPKRYRQDDYDAFIADAKAKIAEHKKRIDS